MMGSLVTILLFLMLGGGAGLALGGDTLAALLGALCGALTWFALDLWWGRRVMRWLVQAQDWVPTAWGRWSEVADRVRRLLRQQQRLLTASQTSLEQFLSAIQASPNGVLMLDAEMRITWCNTMAAQHLGIEPARDMAQLIGNLVRSPEFSQYLNGADHSRPVLIDGRSHRPDHPQRLALQLFPYGEGKHLLLSQDITAVQLSETMRRDFVANVSHEIRTPLTVLAGFVETLQQLELTPQQQSSYLDLMSRQTQRMQSLVDDLLTLSRLEGSPLPGLEATPLAEFWTTLQADARSLDAVLSADLAGGHEVVFSPPDAPDGACLGRRTELQSAMSNLLANALRYTQPGGRVEVAWRIGALGEGLFSVRDNGPGIAPEHLPRITERFYRIDRSRSRETGGTGLGLAIVKHVAQRHGGELGIESQVGLGSVFSITLPAYRVTGPSGALAADHRG